MDDLVQVIVVNKSLHMTPGKAAAQVAHAAVRATLRSHKDTVKRWLFYGETKIVLKVHSLTDLFNLEAEAESKGLVTALIRDEGRTGVPPGSYTCMAIGPAPREQLDPLIGDLKLY